MPRARRLIVHGHVQGVFFRDSVCRAAQRLGVRGWARNLEDGTVELHLEGPPAAVQAIEDYAAEGPPRARVERVDAQEAEPEGHEDFTTG